MKTLYWCSILVLLSLLAAGCFGSGAVITDDTDAESIWSRFEAMMAPELEWLSPDEIDLDELERFLQEIFPYYADEFVVRHELVDEVIELQPKSFGDIWYYSRSFTQNQIFEAIETAKDHGWGAVTTLDAMDMALLGELLRFHGRCEDAWLDHLDELFDDPDLTGLEGYPKAATPVLVTAGSEAELVMEWINAAEFLYEGNFLIVTHTITAVVQWQKHQGVWSVAQLAITEATARHVPVGFFNP